MTALVQRRAGAERVIDARGLTRRFGDFVAVNQIDVSVERGEVFGLLGANGAGKTTAIRMLCGLLPASDGTVTVAGVDMRRYARRARRHIGYVAQLFALYADLTVLENLKLQAGLYGLVGARKRERLEVVLGQLQLGDIKDHVAGELPLGFKRRLSLAGALLHDPEVLFLDEPTSGVDPVARQQFWALIYHLAEAGIGILVTTHYMDEAMFCDRLALMDQGSIVAQGSPDELSKRPMVTPLLTLDTDDAGRWYRLLKTWPLVKEVVPHAGQLRIRLMPDADVGEVRDRISRQSRETGFGVGQVLAAQPELEDVFVDVLEGRARESVP